MTFNRKAAAKINLRLKVLGKRPDKYHDLSMFNATVSLYDDLTVTPRSDAELRLIVERPDGTRLTELEDISRNLVTRAFLAMSRHFDLQLGADIRLTKAIPWGAGLGGGSSDAAQALRVAGEQAVRLGAPTDEVESALPKLALQLGADVPYLLGGRPAWVRGIGDEIHELPAGFLTPFELLLVLTPVHLSTPRVFDELNLSSAEAAGDSAFDHFRHTANAGKKLTHGDLLTLIENDLERPAVALSPELGVLLEELRAIAGIKPFMSGSGAALAVCHTASPQFSFPVEKRVREVVRELTRVLGWKSEVQVVKVSVLS